MKYTQRILHIITVPAGTLKYTIPEVTKWMSDNDIKCTVNFVKDEKQKSKVIAYEFILENEEDAVTFKIQWL